ncbi:MAG: DUF1287 domain-containing protein [Cypionkella sp.]
MKALALILFAFPAFAGEPAQLITPARTQVEVTVIYDPAYVSMVFPGGDIDPSRGVCTDVVSWMLPQNLPHSGILSDKMAAGGAYPLALHTIGRGAQEEDMLFAAPISGHYRLNAAAQAWLLAMAKG